jgi:hypothetical protein
MMWAENAVWMHGQMMYQQAANMASMMGGGADGK